MILLKAWNAFMFIVGVIKDRHKLYESYEEA